ncbi:MAG: nucleotidyltransferase family protein, partial [Pseudomonadota bacterium]
MQGALGDLTCLLSHRPIADPAAIDWPALADLALDRHRIGPTIAKAVLALDPPRVVAARFQDDLEAAGFAALSEKAETIRQVEALRARGCDPVLLKGWPLAERLFGSASLRHSKDIDFHLSPERVPSAITCLTEQGYAPVPGHRRRVKLVLRQVPSVLAETNDIAFYHPSGRQIELHWRLSQLSGWT